MGGRFKVLQLLPKKVSYFRIYSPTLTCVSPVSRMIRQIGTVKRIHTHTHKHLSWTSYHVCLVAGYLTERIICVSVCLRAGYCACVNII